MPLLPEGSDLNLVAGGYAHNPDEPTPPPSPSALDVAAAAERSANLAGAAYEHFIGNPGKRGTVVPGFDPLTSVPDGYKDRAELFLSAQSPEDMARIRGQIDQEDRDRRTIASAGGWGVASTLAAGMTDPLTIASMALPGGGQTRLAQAGRLALVNAATSGAQEVAMHGLTQTRTMNESLLNVGASAVLGGILGAVITPKVHGAEVERVHAAVAADFERGANEALGPIERALARRPCRRRSARCRRGSG